MKPTYRDKRSDDQPHSSEYSICVHCDGGDGVACTIGECKCDCHRMLRKTTCLCGIKPLSCCCGCGCKCHAAEWAEYLKREKKKWNAEQAEARKLEKARKKKDGVELWEIEVYNALRPAKNEFTRDRMFAFWLENRVGNRKIETKETGSELVRRVAESPWGRANA